MPKGRKPTPRAIASIRGAVKAHPERYQGEEPKNPNPLGDPPGHLNALACRIWHEIDEHCIPGVLTQADRYIVELLAVLMSQFRQDPDEFTAAKMAHLRQGLGSLGMTPADRMRLNPGKGKDKGSNPFADL